MKKSSFCLLTPFFFCGILSASLMIRCKLRAVAITGIMRQLQELSVMKYFIRIDYIFRCSPVQRVRALCPSLNDCLKLIAQYKGDDFMILGVRMERCA